MKRIILIFLFFLLIYTRFVGLEWGLPYPLHPDERNMANAIQRLDCQIPNKFPISNFQFLKKCFNPHFFAYGQFSLYLGYFIIQVYHFFVGKFGLTITFEEAVISLRMISAVATIINAMIMIKIIKTIIKLKTNDYFFLLFIIIFSPYFIQFSHFGTTEALLMLFYSLVIYYSLQLFNKWKWRTIFFLSLFSGLAIATKVSAVIFIGLPIIAILNSKSKIRNQKPTQNALNIKAGGSKLQNKIQRQKTLLGYTLHVTRYMIIFLLLTGFFALFFSPHNLVSFPEFLGSISYESEVALGKIKVFYTRQFEKTIPILFQMIKIFPYTLGLLGSILGSLGFLGLPWKGKKTNLLRLAFLIYFLPNAFLYTKWTRFMAPVFPIITIFIALLLLKIKVIKIIKVIIVILTIIPGVAYLSIYQNPDVRFIASEWIYKNIPQNSFILSETANVVDIPISPPNYQLPIINYQSISFNFYDVDVNPILQKELHQHIAKADYIFVPSRRVFANHTCYEKRGMSFESKDSLQLARCRYLKEKYPLLNDYYQKLFSEKLRFKKVVEFTSYPRIYFLGKKIIEFPDENAEETWTVFDHPVIRIYESKIKN